MPAAQDKTARAYEPPMVTQFSVFLDNKVGRLLHLLEIFQNDPTRIASVSVMDSSTHGVVRLICSDSDRTAQLLDEHDFPYATSDMLVVELGPGQTPRTMCQALLALEVNIHYLYPLMMRPNNRPTLVVYTDDQTLAGQILLRKGYQLFGERDLGGELEAA